MRSNRLHFILALLATLASMPAVAQDRFVRTIPEKNRYIRANEPLPFDLDGLCPSWLFNGSLPGLDRAYCDSVVTRQTRLSAADIRQLDTRVMPFYRFLFGEAAQQVAFSARVGRDGFWEFMEYRDEVYWLKDLRPMTDERKEALAQAVATQMTDRPDLRVAALYVMAYGVNELTPGQALRAIAQIKDRVAFELLKIEASQDAQPERRKAATVALNLYGGKEAALALAGLLSAKDRRFETVANLAEIGGPTVVQVLASLLRSDDAELRGLAASGLRRIGDAAARDALAAEIAYRDAEVQKALGKVAGEEQSYLQSMSEKAQRLRSDHARKQEEMTKDYDKKLAEFPGRRESIRKQQAQNKVEFRQVLQDALKAVESDNAAALSRVQAEEAAARSDANARAAQLRADFAAREKAINDEYPKKLAAIQSRREELAKKRATLRQEIQSTVSKANDQIEKQITDELNALADDERKYKESVQKKREQLQKDLGEMRELAVPEPAQPAS